MNRSVCKIGLLVLIHPSDAIQKPTELLATERLHLYVTVEHTALLQDCRVLLYVKVALQTLGMISTARRNYTYSFFWRSFEVPQLLRARVIFPEVNEKFV